MHDEEIHNGPVDDEAPKGTAPDGEATSDDMVSSGAEASEASEVHGIVGIRFEPCGKVYCFKANGLGLRRGERVVVESDLGVSIGRVVIEDFTEQNPEKELKPVLRRVNEEDLRKEQENNELKKEAFAFCNERIMARGLSMKLLGTDATLDRRRIIFFFAAETRIDFRELVKDLAAKFRTRIELRQVGVRDAARIAGGIGICGRELCCRRFLTSFEPISIKMAKKQELALNTSKLSGICGRLMCCLGYEYDEKLLKEKARERTREEPSEAGTALVEIPVDAETVTVAVTVETPQEETRPVEEKPRRRRRRARGRKKHRGEEQEGEQAKKAESSPEQAKSDEKAAHKVDERPQATHQQQQAEDKHSKKPFKRKRRRRMRGKKKE